MVQYSDANNWFADLTCKSITGVDTNSLHLDWQTTLSGPYLNSTADIPDLERAVIKFAPGSNSLVCVLFKIQEGGEGGRLICYDIVTTANEAPKRILDIQIPTRLIAPFTFDISCDWNMVALVTALEPTVSGRSINFTIIYLTNSYLTPINAPFPRDINVGVLAYAAVKFTPDSKYVCLHIGGTLARGSYCFPPLSLEPFVVDYTINAPSTSVASEFLYIGNVSGVVSGAVHTEASGATNYFARVAFPPLTVMNFSHGSGTPGAPQTPYVQAHIINFRDRGLGYIVAEVLGSFNASYPNTPIIGYRVLNASCFLSGCPPEQNITITGYGNMSKFSTVILSTENANPDTFIVQQSFSRLLGLISSLLFFSLLISSIFFFIFSLHLSLPLPFLILSLLFSSPPFLLSSLLMRSDFLFRFVELNSFKHLSSISATTAGLTFPPLVT